MTNPFEIAGRTALVTGASSGLGRHFALLLARHGAKVAIAARRAERLESLKQEIERFDGRALPLHLDVLDSESVACAVREAETELGPLSILVNNAGIAESQGTWEMPEEEWDQVVDTNLKGVFLTAQCAARHMIRHEQGGSIVNIASVLAEHASGRVPAYCASKAGVANLTRSLGIELARYDIRVNAIAPGYFPTDLNEAFLNSPQGEALKQRIPQRRFGQYADLDGVLLLLASDASRYMSGSIITVDGGQTAVA